MKDFMLDSFWRKSWNLSFISNVVLPSIIHKQIAGPKGMNDFSLEKLFIPKNRYTLKAAGVKLAIWQSNIGQTGRTWDRNTVLFTFILVAPETPST